MSTLKATTYKKSLCQGGLGNMAVNVLQYTCTGAEAIGDVILMGGMDAGNTYVSITTVSAARATTTFDIGYISREDGVSDDTDYFVSDAAMTAAQVESIVTAKSVAPKHDLALTVTDDDNFTADDVIEIVVKTVVSAG